MARRPFGIHTLMVDVGFTLTGLLAGLLGLVLAASTMTKADEAAAQATAAGNISIEAIWPDNMDCDVDLWVQGPGDGQAVGYSRRADRQSSYVRDDVGFNGDPGDLNFETTYIRGLLPGRYIVNAHLYSMKGAARPVPVRFAASFAQGAKGATSIARRELVFTEAGQELTAFSFVLGDDGKLEAGSVSEAYIPLRNPGGSE